MMPWSVGFRMVEGLEIRDLGFEFPVGLGLRAWV